LRSKPTRKRTLNLVEIDPSRRFATADDTAEEGGFVAYGPRFAKLYELLAQHAAKLLRGIKVADIPVEQPTKFELAINLKTAKALGLTISESFLVSADAGVEWGGGNSSP